MWHFLLIAAAEPLRSDISTEAARRWALLLMLISLLGVALLVIVSAAWVLRRGRRLRDEARDQAPTPMTDAWAEAGRRARGDLLGEVDDPAAGPPLAPPGGDPPYHPPGEPHDPDFDEGRP